GVAFQKVSNPHNGVDWDDYQRGLEIWRNLQEIHVPLPNSSLKLTPRGNFLPPSALQLLPNCQPIGYVGTDYATAKCYYTGKRRLKSNRPSRWGWGMYVTNNSAM
ncbi:hypothetical protein B0T24DRAFT_495143, partial [Lasiosphaeria ovina]